MNQLVNPLPRAAFWVVVLLLLAGSLATLGVAQAGSSPNYVLTGFASQTSGAAIVGTQVSLQSRATGQIFNTTVRSTGGQFNFTTASTSGTLVPGYWSVWVPAQTNVTYGGNCAPICAILPVNQTPLANYYNATALTTTLYPARLSYTVLDYVSTIRGTVTQGGGDVQGATVQLLDPLFNNLVLVSNVTNSTGFYSLKAPPSAAPGTTWVLRTTVPGGTVSYNLTRVTVPTRGTVTVNPIVQNYLVYGTVVQPNGNPVPNGGNLTVWDSSNNYLYSSPTEAGGFYSFGSYNFSSPGTQTFYVVLSTVGYATNFYRLDVNGATQVRRNVAVTPLATNQRGTYTTLLNFSTINPSTGRGSVSVNTSAYLGNNTVFANLPNVTVGQMWAQLGLNFAHQITLPQADLASFFAWENASGPFFPAIQAGLAINSTGFATPSPTQPQSLTSYAATSCTPCGLTTAGDIQLGWNTTYQLNGTLATNASSYTVSFAFAHPLAADSYNYTIVLPTGYALAAGTAPPTNTRLVPLGPDNTWTKFNLVSLPSPTAQGSASFTIVRYANLTANVNISSRAFFFSTRNVLNQTHNNYTVEVGLGQNITFSALNSTYPAGTNGTKFVWHFGDGGTSTVGIPTTNHTYATASGSTPYAGTLTVTSSGGLVNSTTFYVWVGQGPTTAVILTNATTFQNRTSGGVPYIFINWGTSLTLNASASSAKISPTAPISGVISTANYSLTARGFKVTQVYAPPALYWTNFSYEFLGAGVYYTNHTTIGGVPVYFKGWQYNITLLVWSGSGQSASTDLIVLVNDTQNPVSAFQVLNTAGNPVGGSGVIAGTNLTARVLLNAANATDPHNGTITRFYWLITNSGNSSATQSRNVTTVRQSGSFPVFWLAAQQKAYSINLTVFDLNGNRGWTTQSLSVSVNSTTTPIMRATNLTAPTSFNQGSSYRLSVNITSGGGSRSTAEDVIVSWYTTSPSGTTRTTIAGAPASVQFFNYTNGVASSTPFATGMIATMAFNTTYLAVVQWSPGSTGNFVLYANVTASNEFFGDFVNGPQTVSQSISVSPNPTIQYLEYGGIAAAVVAAIVLIYFFVYRPRSGRGAAPSKGSGRAGSSSSSKSSSKSSSSDDEDDDEDN